MNEQPRTPPSSTEAEEFLLSCVLLDGGYTLSCGINRGLTNECFSSPANRLVYDRLLTMLSSGKPIDTASLCQELSIHKELEGVGGYAFITQITGKPITTAQASYFVDKLVELNNLRTVIRVATGLVEGCYNYTGGGVADMLGKPLDRLLAVSSGGDGEREPTWKELTVMAEEHAQSIIDNKGVPRDRIIDFPWPKMTELFGPMNRGELCLVAGNASMGKSSLLRQMACDAARQGLRVYFDTLEVNPIQVVMQMAATLSRTGIRQLGRVHQREQEDFKTAIRSLASAGITISRRDRWLAQVIARCKTMKARDGLDMICIDYGGLLRDVASCPNGDKVGAIGRVTSTMKDLAGELDCVCVLAWQLNRGNAKDGVHREPVLADLRGSGDLEQDADRAILIYRPAENPITGEGQGSDKSVADLPRYYSTIIQAKGRDVGIGSLGMLFNRSIASFEPLH